MAGMDYFLLGAVIMVMMSLPAVNCHECDCSKYTKTGDRCGTYTAAVQQCVMAAMNAASQLPSNVDLAVVCRIHNETAGCMAAAVTTCDNPPADSKQWIDTWGDMDSKGQRLCSHTPGDTSCGSFEAQAVTCLMAMSNIGPGSSLDEMCQVFEETQRCMDPLVTRCPDEAQGSQMNSGWEMMKQQMQALPC